MNRELKWITRICFTNIVLFHAEVLGFTYHTYQPPALKKVTRYVPSVINKVCLLKTDTGPCRGNIEMYYFEPANMSCEIFKWGGCQGNGNRFDSQNECEDTCKSKQDQKMARPKWCALTFDYGYCFGALHRWYYDPMWKTCKESIYSGCGGNQNNFYNQEQCDQICRFGNRPLKTIKSKASDDFRKVIIVNHYNATTKPNVITTTAPCNGTTSKAKRVRSKGRENSLS